jgi:tetratricopeptide (TPR) repeat protein
MGDLLSNREKLLASAQKSLQKGQISKAIQDYQKIVQIDPRDWRNRQKLAELYCRANMAREAFDVYQAVARSFTENGFYLKAIAVYKQMQKLDPTRVDIYQHLADLNEKQGLIGNALGEYRNLVIFYEKGKMYNEAAGILQKMKAIDPENVQVRVKIVEYFLKGHEQQAAAAELEELVGVFRERKDAADLLKTCEFFAPLLVRETGLQISMAQALIHVGEVDQGILRLNDLIRNNSEDIRLQKSLAEAYRKKEDFLHELDTWHKLIRIAPDDLDCWEGYIRACIDTGEYKLASAALEENRTAFIDAGRRSDLQRLEDSLGNYKGNGNPFAGSSERFDSVSVASFPAVEENFGDLEEIEELEELEELEEIEELEFTAELGELSSDRPGQIDVDIDEVPLEFLEIAEQGDNGAPAQAVEMDFDLESSLDEEFEGEPDAATSGLLEFSLEEDMGEEALADMSADPFFSEEFDESAETAAKADQEEAEAEFYLQQGLFEEAERICRRILKNDPQSPRAALILGKIPDRKKGQGPTREENKGDFFDLAAEIQEEMSRKPAEDTTRTGEVDRFHIDGIFSEFKKGVEAQIDGEDTESHYNLGIAYKEMGLLDDAVAEFDRAMRDPARRVDCLTLKGICQAEGGAPEKAAETFRTGLASPALAEIERISLHYELGLLYEAWQRYHEALEHFQRVADSDNFFRDVGEKLRELRQRAGLVDDSGEPGAKKSRISYV